MPGTSVVRRAEAEIETAAEVTASLREVWKSPTRKSGAEDRAG
jgi:hypothetical protein